MGRPSLSAVGNNVQQVTRSRSRMTVERAYSTPKRIVDVNKKIRNTNRLMDEAYKERDVKTYCELSKAWIAAMDMWMKLVAYPKSATLKAGENPVNHMFPTGGSKYFGDVAVLEASDLTTEEEIVPA